MDCGGRAQRRHRSGLRRSREYDARSEVTQNALPRTIRKNLQIHDAFTLTEGNKAIGNGIIIKEVNKKETSLEELV